MTTTPQKNPCQLHFLLDRLLTAMIPNKNSDPIGIPIMKIKNKINPIAKLLRDKQYSKQVVPNKKKSKLDKLVKKELRDGKTSQDT